MENNGTLRQEKVALINLSLKDLRERIVSMEGTSGVLSDSERNVRRLVEMKISVQDLELEKMSI